jgi:hypothetical protein
MRPPGTFNYKDARNGRPPLPCTLCAYSPQLRYPLDVFSPWMTPAEVTAPAPVALKPAHPAAKLSFAEVLSKHPQAAELVCRLDKPSQDRSRRDFAIVCGLLRLGLSSEEIWPLVCGSSKFQSSGRTYFERTVTSAQKAIVADGAAPRRLREGA